MSFTPIKTNRVFRDVLVQLKESILTGRFRAGDKLPSERELTQELQVSRAVIREAILALELSGFVVMRQGPAGGAFVTELTFDKVGNAFLDLFLTGKLSMAEVAQVRIHVEPEVARLAAVNLKPPYRALLHRALENETPPFLSFEDRIDKLTEVHRLLAEICGNYFFEAIVSSMMKLTREVVLKVERDPDTSAHGPGEHIRIVDAVLKGDGESAAREMLHHLRGFAERLTEMEKIYRRSFLLEEETVGKN
jgi:DNA-binding FadR family transcriptional regulator